MGYADHRSIRADLEGSFQGMVEFAQSHTIPPNGTDALYLPRLVSERAALLMFTPSAPLPPRGSIRVERTVDQVPTGETLQMHRPSEFPESDIVKLGDRPYVYYSKRAWSVQLPWNWMRPGLGLIFRRATGESGSLRPEQLEWHGAPHVVFHSIRLGMLTPPPGNERNAMEIRTAEFATDYLAKIPASKLTVVQYLPAHFPKIVLADGTVYTDRSADKGSRHGGDMREDIAKSLVGKGINFANFGIHSSAGGVKEQIFRYPQVVVHQAEGMYSNGLKRHGLSGGNGIATLTKIWLGNQFSHEVGHVWRLPHYPGPNTHHEGSGWGYDAYLHRLIGNLDWELEPLTKEWLMRNGPWKGLVFTAPPFNGQFTYGSDPMGGGRPMGGLSMFSHYTGYAARSIQGVLNAWPNLDANSPSGYSYWNAEKRAMEPFVDGAFLKPIKSGVPVTTIVGFYDPLGTRTAMVYPPLHANWGNLYTLDDSKPDSGCWLAVRTAVGTKYTALANTILDERGRSNKFHLNIETALNPSHAAVGCGDVTQAEAVLPAPSEVLPPPLTVGGDQEYLQLARRINKLDDRFHKIHIRSRARLLRALAEIYGPIHRWEQRNEAKIGSLFTDHLNEAYMLIGSSPGEYPVSGTDNDQWRYMGDPGQIATVEPEPISARALALEMPGADLDTLLMRYYDVDQIKTYQENDTGAAPGDLFMGRSSLNYYMLRTHGYSKGFPPYGRIGEHWHPLPDRASLSAAFGLDPADTREAFEARILKWWKQDSFPECVEGEAAVPGTIYRSDRPNLLATLYYRVNEARCEGFPKGAFSNEFWQYLGKWAYQ